MDWRNSTALDLIRGRAPRFVPPTALAAVEALLESYGTRDGKYVEQWWHRRTTAEHAAACGRHLAGFLAGAPDAESGESHAIHLAARALQLVAVEIGPPYDTDDAEVSLLVDAFLARRDRYRVWYGEIESLWPFAAWQRLQEATAAIETLRAELKRGRPMRMGACQCR